MELDDDLYEVLKHAYVRGFTAGNTKGITRQHLHGFWMEYEPAECSAYHDVIRKMSNEPNQGHFKTTRKN